MSHEDRLRIDAYVDLMTGLCLVLAALVRHSQTDGTGPAGYLLWTFAILAGLRALTRFTAAMVEQEKRDPDPRDPRP
jgi:hypothetical protein